jgi:hypothetical protein
MSKEKHMTQIWISYKAYRKLLATKGLMQRQNRKLRTLDEVIDELIDFGKSALSLKIRVLLA